MTGQTIYPVTRMVHVLESAGCTNGVSGAVALIEDQQVVRALVQAFADLPEPGTPMARSERDAWVARFTRFLETYLRCPQDES